jgi:hypothetical protein
MLTFLIADLAALIRVRGTLTNCVHELRKNQHDYLCLFNALQYIGNLLAIWEGRDRQSNSVEPMPDWRFLIALKGFDDIIKAPPQVSF